MNYKEKYESMSEEILVSHIVEGDMDAFEYLVESYNKRIFNVCLRLLGNYEDACDLTQEIFLKIYRKIHTFKENCSLYTWIYRLSVNSCIDELRKRKNINIIPIDAPVKTDEGDMTFDITDDSLSTEDILLQKEQSSLIFRSVSQLPDIYRILLILREYDGLSYEEISKIVKIPIGTVKSRINRARSMLRNMLKEGNYFD